jgi:methylmalonyl-CoA mutase N-terminal domain/subunit
MIPALESGFFRREIADAAFTYQREVDARRKLIVSVNAFQEADEKPIETLQIDDAVEKEQVTKLRARKQQRDAAAVRKHLDAVKREAAAGVNLMPALIEAAEARCAVGEVMHALADVFGRYDGAARW